MKMKVIYSNGILEYTLQKELYTKEVILEAIANSIILAFTDSSGKDISLQLQNIIAIELD
jgi:hypothetical protein